jgi:UDP-GlcNAc:undecaprenyl-phosphate GlcNAc-1-phosphate transferase
MPDLYLLSLILSLLGAVIALVVGLWARPLGEAFVLLDHPDPSGGRKLHLEVTPLVGGFAVVTAGLLGVSVLSLLDPALGSNLSIGFWFAASVFGMFLVGVLDDRDDLPPLARLFITGLVLLVPVLMVPEFQVRELHFVIRDTRFHLEGILGIGFTLLCLVGLLNAVNMADGKNGLVIGQAIIWSVVLAIRLPADLLPLMGAIMGALVVLLHFNLRGRLFLGDGGSYAISAMFGLLAILAWNLRDGAFHAGDIVVIFALPVIDTLRLIGHRLLEGRSPFDPGRDHLHHYLHRRWRWPAPLPFVLGLVAVTNAGALLMPGTGLHWSAVTLVGYVAMLFLAMREPRRAGA